MKISRITRTIPDSEYTDPIIASIGVALGVTVVVVSGTLTLILHAFGWMVKKVVKIFS